MAVKLKIHELAHQELLDAILWYNEVQPGLGKRFHETVTIWAIAHLHRRPSYWQSREKN
jgi:hypothetical protein